MLHDFKQQQQKIQQLIWAAITISCWISVVFLLNNGILQKTGTIKWIGCHRIVAESKLSKFRTKINIKTHVFGCSENGYRNHEQRKLNHSSNYNNGFRTICSHIQMNLQPLTMAKWTKCNWNENLWAKIYCIIYLQNDKFIYHF